jgi:hypothetical protein
VADVLPLRARWFTIRPRDPASEKWLGAGRNGNDQGNGSEHR